MPCLKDSTVIVIAMENRKDYIQKELIKYGILNFHLIDAVDGRKVGENYLQNHLISNVGKMWVQPYGHSKITPKLLGKMGCFLSHIKALRYCITEKIEGGVFILEDDCLLNVPVADLEIDIPSCAEIVYLGGFYDKKDKSKDLKYHAGLNQIISEDIKFYTSHSYYVSSPSDLFKNCINKRPKAWDAFLITYIQKRNRCYFFSPSLINQAPWLPSNIDLTTKYSKKKFNF
jgi:hypothetical protein